MRSAHLGPPSRDSTAALICSCYILVGHGKCSSLPHKRTGKAISVPALSLTKLVDKTVSITSTKLEVIDTKAHLEMEDGEIHEATQYVMNRKGPEELMLGFTTQVN